MHLPGAVNGEAFLLDVKAVPVPQLWPGAVVVLDNPGAHRVKAVRTGLEAAGARLEYRPPYSHRTSTPSNGLGANSKSHRRKVRRQDHRNALRRYR